MNDRLDGNRSSWSSVSRSGFAFLILAALVAASACTSSPAAQVATAVEEDSKKDQSTETPADAKDPQDAMLDFARCMREHGVEMADPEVEESGRFKARIGIAAPEPGKLEEADRACRHLLKGAGMEGAKPLDPGDQDAFLNFARCMREHGVDMPDPDPSGGGLVLKAGTGPNPEDDPKFKEADKACHHHLAPIDRKIEGVRDR